jgi:hypothetical protein
MNDDGKRYLFDNPRNVRLVVRGLTAVCILLFALDFVVHRHLSHPLEELFGFYAVYGFVACVLLVLLAAEMRKLVMRDEDFYGPYEESEAHDDAPEAGPKTGAGDEHV